MESGTNSILTNCGRSGQWFTYNDGNGTQYPPAGLPDGGNNFFTPTLLPVPRGSSLYAAHTYGGGFTSYAGMGLTLNGVANGRNGPYNAQSYGYTGFRFWAMLGSSQPGAQAIIEFHATDKYSDAAGGLCSTSTTGTNRCFDNPKIKVSLGPVWTLVNVPFAELARTGWGNGGATTPLDSTTLYVIGFEDNSQTGNLEPFNFDVWIDDISFTP
jgi:hypothetical protein